MNGQVVLDAIIQPDGTVGDVTVLRATNDAFAQSAIAAVKQWRYTAPGFEGILTVSVNFTLNAWRFAASEQLTGSVIACPVASSTVHTFSHLSAPAVDLRLAGALLCRNS